jgi:ATP-dependent Lhr-like helicase
MHEALGALGVVTDLEVARQPGWDGWLAMLAESGRATRLSNGLWATAEQFAEWLLLYPDAVAQPAIVPPAEHLLPTGHAGQALHALLRARLGGLGPATAASLAVQLQRPLPEIDAALVALQTEGDVLQGRFTPDTSSLEWCERHLLARIHRYTLRRLRQEIEPVEPRDFARFLFDWQQVGQGQRRQGPEALPAVLAQLEGYEAAAGIWEAEILPARLSDYASPWLDELCTAGRIAWTRLRPGATGTRGGGSLRGTPVLLLPRRHVAVWSRVAPGRDDAPPLGSRAQRLLDHLQAHGASFFDEMLHGTRLLQSELEEALAELVVRGRASCDSFAGLRALMVPPSKRAPKRSRHRVHRPLFGIEDAGRWALLHETDSPTVLAEADLEHVVKTLLRRYGVIAWRLLEREAAWLPRWRDLVRVCRRLEARGELRGGRFIAGVSGEQFALPEAVVRMREVRRGPPDTALLCLAAADPANLLGSLLPGPSLPRVPGSRVLYRDGLPVATLAAGVVTALVPMTAALQREAERALTMDSAARSLLGVDLLRDALRIP